MKMTLLRLQIMKVWKEMLAVSVIVRTHANFTEIAGNVTYIVYPAIFSIAPLTLWRILLGRQCHCVMLIDSTMVEC